VLELLLTASRDCHVRALLRKRERDRAADASSTTGDESPFAFEREHAIPPHE